MESFDLSVGLRMSHPDPGMDHLLVPQVREELGGEILWAVVGDDAGLGQALGKGLQGPLDDEFDIGSRHGQAKIPEDDGPGVAVENTDKKVMRAPEVDIGNVGVPLLMGSPRLIEALSGSFPSVRKSPSAGQTGLSEHAEDRGGRDGHNPLSNIMYASRTPPTVGFWRLKATIFSRSSAGSSVPWVQRPPDGAFSPKGSSNGDRSWLEDSRRQEIS